MKDHDLGKFEGMVLTKLDIIEKQIKDISLDTRKNTKKINRIYYFAGGVSATVTLLITFIKAKILK